VPPLPTATATGPRPARLVEYVDRHGIVAAIPVGATLPSVILAIGGSFFPYSAKISTVFPCGEPTYTRCAFYARDATTATPIARRFKFGTIARFRPSQLKRKTA